MTQPPVDIDPLLLVLQSRYGDPFHVREREAAAQTLLECSTDSYPRVIQLLSSGQAQNPAALLELLPRFAREDSVAVLEALMLNGGERLPRLAAIALARHAGSAARDALIKALDASSPDIVVAAADGLLERGDNEACAALISRSSIDDAQARYHILQAALHLDCIGIDALRRIMQSDPDQDVRDLMHDAIAAKESRND